MRTTATLDDEQAEYLTDVREREGLESDAGALRWCVDFARAHEDELEALRDDREHLETLRDDLEALRDDRKRLLGIIEGLERDKRWLKTKVDSLQNEKLALLDAREDTKALVRYQQASWWTRLKWRFTGDGE